MRERLVVACLLLLAVALSGSGQGYPLPGPAAAAPVTCASCTGTNDFRQPNAGLPTWPYSQPLLYAGRYVDSQVTGNFQHGSGFRTIRARQIRQTATRLYVQMGNAVGSYRLDAFFSSKLPGGLRSVRDVARTANRGAGVPPEKLVVWDGFVYPEVLVSGWFAPGLDQQDPLGKGGSFDVDDRGYVYVGYPTFGWGIAHDDGRTNGTHLPKIVQMVAAGDQVDQGVYPNTRSDATAIAPDSIVSIRSGSRYHVIIAGVTNSQAVWDVTDPAAPQLMSQRPGPQYGVRKWDRSDSVGKLAYVDGRKVLRVMTYQSAAANGAFAASYAGTDGGFADVAFDEAGNIWAVEDGAQLWRITPSGVATQYRPFAGVRAVRALAVGGGYLAIVGTDRTDAKYDVRLATIDAGAPRSLDVSSFFKRYYHSGLAGYAEPGPYTLPCDLQIVRWSGKAYLFYSAEGLGDVFVIGGSSGPSDPPAPPADPPPPCTCTCCP